MVASQVFVLFYCLVRFFHKGYKYWSSYCNISFVFTDAKVCKLVLDTLVKISAIQNGVLFISNKDILSWQCCGSKAVPARSS
ncbi:hypothetical protein V5799_018538 [Amblyomma americanum]|uniref:Uncharacterized protein n=1 Tax=Amblyomma americanum TaxID=6943 RepID=A0AAQ4EZ86_AMBAM